MTVQLNEIVATKSYSADRVYNKALQIYNETIKNKRFFAHNQNEVAIALSKPALMQNKEFVANNIIQNSNQMVQNSGLEFNITPFTQVLPEIMMQEVYELGMKDKTPIKLTDLIPIESKPQFAFSDKAIYMKQRQAIDINNLGDGATPLNAMAGVKSDSTIELEPEEILNYGKKQDVGYNYMEYHRMQSAMLYPIDLLQEKMKAANYKIEFLRQRGSVVGFTGATGYTFRGLMNQNITPDATLIPDYLSLLTDAEFQTVLNKLSQEKYGRDDVGTIVKDTLIVPLVDDSMLRVKPYIAVSDAGVSLSSATFKSRLDALEGLLNITVYPSAFCNKNDVLNPQGANAMYIFYQKNSNILRQFTTLEPTFLGFGTKDNFSFEGALLNFYTEVKLIRDKGMKYYTTI